jgi:hypothetical protein
MLNKNILYSRVKFVSKRYIFDKFRGKPDKVTIKKEHIEKRKEEIELCENSGSEFNRSSNDPTDKTKPFDNFEAKLRPELWDQMEKRKDVFHTKDTLYVRQEKEKGKDVNKKSDEGNKSKDDIEWDKIN